MEEGEGTIVSKIKVIFVRHGQTNQNIEAQASGKNVKERDDPLNQTGIEQAKEVANKLKEYKFDVAVTSPLKRAHQTAQIINQYHNLQIEIEDDLRERFINDTVSGPEWQRLFEFGSEENKTVDGENLEVFFKRVYGCIERLIDKYHGKTVLVVAHGGVHHAFYAYSNKLALKGSIRISPLENCEFREYDLERST